MSETSETFIMVLCLIIGVIFACVCTTYIDKVACEKRAVITETECKYDWLVGCYYKEGSKWVKYNEENSEAKKVYIKGVSK